MSISRLTNALYEKFRRAKEFFFFEHQRIGLGGQPFTIYKFRTMIGGSELEHAMLLEQSSRDGFGNIIDDLRITPFGRYLRMFWLDEIPQFWNIMRRDMNLVGPRHLMPEDHANLPDYLRKERVKIKPGLMPPTYADYFSIQSDENRWASEMQYHMQRQIDPLTNLKYFFRILGTMAELANYRLTLEMYKWNNSISPDKIHPFYASFLLIIVKDTNI